MLGPCYKSNSIVGIKDIPGQEWRGCSLEHVAETRLEKYGTETNKPSVWFKVIFTILEIFTSVYVCLCARVYKSFWLNQKINSWRNNMFRKEVTESRFLCESQFLMGMKEG